MQSGYPKTLVEAIEDYYEAKHLSLSKSTWAAHERAMERWREWVVQPSNAGPNPLLIDIEDRMMVRYFNRLRPPVLSGSTFNNYRQYLLSFWTFCTGEGWIVRNPMRHVDRAVQTRRPRLQLSAQELERCLEEAENPRDRAAYAVAMNTCLRGGDIAGLVVGNVNLTNDALHAFVRKNQTWLDLPITAELHDEMERWFKSYAETMGLANWRTDLPNEWTLIPPMQWTATNVWNPTEGTYTYKVERRLSHPHEIAQRAIAKLGHDPRGEGFHTFRRSGARRTMELAEAAGDRNPIRIAQAMLDHKHQNTTEIYLEVTEDRRRRDELLRGQRFISRVADNERERLARRDNGDELGKLAAV